MRNPLELTFAIGNFQYDKLTAEEKCTLEITDIRERLRYYNQHVKSLSAHATIAQIYIDSSEGHYKVFCNCLNCALKPEYDPEEEKIYLEERDIEVVRIKTAVDKFENYIDKLNCLVTIKAGKINLESLQVWDNVPLDKNDPDWRGLHLHTPPIINLHPESKEEIQSHNLLLKSHISRSISQPELYSYPYTGFLFSEAKKAFNNRLIKAIDPRQLIEEFIGKIEKHFSYPELADYREPFTKYGDIDQNAVFNSIAKGNDFDYSERKLAVYFLQKIIHVEQVLDFYKYLLNLKDQTSVAATSEFTEDEIKMQTWEYHLRQFIDIATRWKIAGIYRTVTENQPYSSILGGYIIKSRLCYENFKAGLRNYLATHNITEAMRIDLEDRYLGMFTTYYGWYSENEQETLCFDPNNPYKVMLEFIRDTHKYIQRFYPLFGLPQINKEVRSGYRTLNDLFAEADSFDECVNALRGERVRVIDNTNRYLLGERQKGSIVAWVEVLKLRGKIKQDIDRGSLAELLNAHFEGLNISDRTLSNVGTTSYKKYIKVLTTLIN